MATVKQRTVNGETFKLKKLKNKHPDLSSSDYMYVVEFGDGDRLDPRFSKENAERVFDKTVKERGGSSGGLGGMLGF